MKKELGKIKEFSFGKGGYDNAMIGFTIDLGGEGWGVGDFWGHWSHRLETAQWSEKDRLLKLGEISLKVAQLLKDANTDNLNNLIGKPVEVTFNDNNTLDSWRILKEVI